MYGVKMNKLEKIYLTALVIGFIFLYFQIGKGIELTFLLLSGLYVGSSWLFFKEHLFKYFVTADVVAFASIFSLHLTAGTDLAVFLLFVAMASFFGSIFYKFMLSAGFIRIKKKQMKEKKRDKNLIYADEVPLKEWLKLRIFGQDEAVDEITKQIKVNIKKAERKGVVPRVLGTFLFVGQTGVGKTETAKALAEWFWDKYGHQFLRFDMGNFSDMNTASTLTGSPKGYIGSEEGGALTRPLMQNPKAVILFDEIEKGHPSIYKTFMSLIDEGEIQEVSTGKRVFLNQSVIVFTSNLYQNTINEINQKVFDEVKKEMLIRDVLSGKLEEASRIVGDYIVDEDLRRFTSDLETTHFPSEFVARIDKVVPFKSLSIDDLANIVANVLYVNGIQVNENKVWELTKKYEPIAREYGVRVFIKKVEEKAL